MLKKVDFWAVGLGLLANIVASIFIPLTVRIFLGGAQLPLWAFFVIGILCDVLGGYISAKNALKNKLFNAVLVGVPDVVITILCSDSDYLPIWYFAWDLVLTFPAVLYGGLLWKKHNK
ncbi:hypothetical protein C0Z01_00430 [Photobacterium kishitanii]|uniref:hypothetical protein n=1 Tax=Photobacterium kishitanii TaxID=318456 RepID=UPI0007EF5FF1|nr:hypothetical protein [Photobacterium kishitanii]OBU29307.1 hypothetical protein AYY22_01970 [Photobacterium kishitanii]PSW71502.1 hypothetical protein C0Z01_00430 [Photobacterium kishitanii]